MEMYRIRLGVYFLLAAFLNFSCKSNSTDSELASSGSFILQESEVPDYEKDLDHQGLLTALGDRYDESIRTGEHIYNNVCFNCHGNPEQLGSIPTALKFWEDTFNLGKDPY